MSIDRKSSNLLSIKERFLNSPFLSWFIPIVISFWLLSITAYYFIHTMWFSFIGGQPDTRQLIADALALQWVPVFLFRLPNAFYALILNFIALLIGNSILRWLKVGFDSNINRIIFSIPLGWGIYSVGIFYLGISGLLYKEAVYCFLTLLGILSVLEIERFFREWKVLAATSRFKIDKTDLVFSPVIIIFIAVQFVISFSPVWLFDPLVYHMALPKLYMGNHALVHVPGFFYSTLPAHTNMLYLLGLIASGENLSKLFCFSISTLFLISIFSVGNRYFSKGVGYLAVVIMIQSAPFFSGLFSEPYVDAAFGLFSLLGIYAFFMWIENRKEGYLYLSIVNCAFAAATKIHGLFFVLLFFGGFLVTVKMDKKFLRKLAWCFLAVGIIALPWYIRSWWLTGDPIFPFFFKYLGTKHWNECSNECFRAFNSQWGGVKSFSDFTKITKDIVLSGGINIFTFVFLIPVLIMLGGKNRQISLKASSRNALLALFFIAIVYYIFFLFTSPQFRFFYLGFVILSIIAAYFIKVAWTNYLLTRIPIILCVVALFIASFPLFGGMSKDPFFVGLGVLDQRQFLEGRNATPYDDPPTMWRWGSYYKASMWINDNLPQDSKILTWYMHGYHMERECVLVNPAFQNILDFSGINDATTFLKSIKELGVTHLLYLTKGSMIPERQREFLGGCVFELRKSGKITLIKQIGNCIIYSVAR